MISRSGLNNYNFIFYLTLCLILFLFRVLAQLIQKFFNLPFLPSFNAWHSSTLDYSWLLASQVIILLLMVWVLAGFIKNTVTPKYRFGVLLTLIGGTYFLGMIVRLIAGLTFASQHHWFGAHIPTIFHIVLATFVLLVGRFHLKMSKKVSNE
jgi:hypothetical protein